MEHHSNIVPWQMACEATGATLRVIPMNDAGELRAGRVREAARRRTEARRGQARVELRWARSTRSRRSIDAGARRRREGAGRRGAVGRPLPDGRAGSGRDFYAFSGHKLFGPTGIGVLYGKRELLEAMPPYQGGGDMIESVTFEKTTYAELPNKFEAGTPNIAGAIGLGAAIDYVTSIGFENVRAYEARTAARTRPSSCRKIPGLRIIGTAKNKASVISFVLETRRSRRSISGMQLDLEGIAVRTGHHCCQPVMDRFGIPATTRDSLAMYNTSEDVDAVVAAIRKIREADVKKIAGGESRNDTAARPTAKRRRPAWSTWTR